MQKLKTFKDVEGMLYGYKKVKAEINDLAIDIEELQEEVQGIRGKGNNEIMQGSPTNATSNPVEDEIIRKEEEVERLTRIKRGKERHIRKIDNMLTTISDEEQEFVRLKYIECKKGKEIESTLGISKDGCSSKRKVIISSLVTFINNTKNTL